MKKNRKRHCTSSDLLFNIYLTLTMKPLLMTENSWLLLSLEENGTRDAEISLVFFHIYILKMGYNMQEK